MNIKKYVFQKAAINHIPVSGTFELTPRCNLSCEMCYIRMSPAEEAMMGTELITEQWLSLGRQAVASGMIYLLLTGGEPLLRPDFTDIYTGMAEMGVILSLNTNGTCVDERIVRCLAKHPPEKVNVTLYGASPDTYQEVCGSAPGYKAALRGITLLKKAGIAVCINTTFTRHNAADMEKIVSYAKEKRIPIRMTSYLFPPLRCGREAASDCFLSPEEYGRLGAAFDLLTMDEVQKERRMDILARIQERTDLPAAEGKAASCMAGRGAFWITWDGRLLPCGMLPELGNRLKQDGFADAWHGMDQIMDAQLLPARCGGCAKKLLCPVCVAVTQSSGEPPEALCRYCESYLSTMTDTRRALLW